MHQSVDLEVKDNTYILKNATEYCSRRGEKCQLYVCIIDVRTSGANCRVDMLLDIIL